ncbi:hypothetical protein SAMN05428988_3147 [Chitinophaga sp. YR573]|uniref:hypothetical protein n=1 Tax=Chitinophaga sp. YR573 TaxID=1881040 RepID=UPI0008B59E02|nr:hypothetical protein [Chitinophaga sp. YR573]SEW20908.1 hypothetical protein SAMN05428988_3147 [Chitinophaga sp. YR573]
MKPYSTKFRGCPKYIAHKFKGIPSKARGITKSARQQIIIANRSRHKSERQNARLLIKKELEQDDDSEIKVILILENGVLQPVYSNYPLKYALVYYDEDKKPVEGVFESDHCQFDLKELYNHPDIEKYMDIYDQLCRLNF